MKTTLHRGTITRNIPYILVQVVPVRTVRSSVVHVRTKRCRICLQGAAWYASNGVCSGERPCCGYRCCGCAGGTSTSASGQRRRRCRLLLFQDVQGHTDAQVRLGVSGNTLLAIAKDIGTDPAPTNECSRVLVVESGVKYAGDVSQARSQEFTNGQFQPPSIRHGERVLDEAFSEGFSSYYGDTSTIVLQGGNEKLGGRRCAFVGEQHDILLHHFLL
mmetsp:Transcript_12161/g.25604  ORF Transcript_12161/g.25604 Transcript_12161/m.25604 type:complete len:217 (-) Transcript_12161:2220-2870(-)